MINVKGLMGSFIPGSPSFLVKVDGPTLLPTRYNSGVVVASGVGSENDTRAAIGDLIVFEDPDALQFHFSDGEALLVRPNFIIGKIPAPVVEEDAAADEAADEDDAGDAETEEDTEAGQETGENEEAEEEAAEEEEVDSVPIGTVTPAQPAEETEEQEQETAEEAGGTQEVASDTSKTESV